MAYFFDQKVFLGDLLVFEEPNVVFFYHVRKDSGGGTSGI